MNELKLITLFYHIDNFCKVFEPNWEKMLLKDQSSFPRWWKTRNPSLSLSEIMTIVILFHISKSWTFKDYYQGQVENSKHFFPKLVSYSPFISLIKQIVIP